MKKRHILLALAALFIAGSAGQAQAQSKIMTLDRMKWVRGISSYGLGNTDSTRISIPGAGGAIDYSDTTAWLDLGQYKFAQDYTAQPLAWFQLNRQLGSGTDSVSYILQYSNDLGSAANPAATTYGTVSIVHLNTVANTTYGITAGADGYVASIVVVSPSTMAAHVTGTVATLPWRFVRLIVSNQKVATNRLYFSVRPVLYGVQ